VYTDQKLTLEHRPTRNGHPLWSQGKGVGVRADEVAEQSVQSPVEVEEGVAARRERLQGEAGPRKSAGGQQADLAARVPATIGQDGTAYGGQPSRPEDDPGHSHAEPGEHVLANPGVDAVAAHWAKYGPLDAANKLVTHTGALHAFADNS
jgi:hypothetical protein